MTSHSVEPQTTGAVLMVRPANFGSNPETADTNFFQQITTTPGDLARRAQHQFDSVVRALERVGVEVIEVAGRQDATLPDEVFPNNWLSLHGDGTAVLYPMLAVNRRLERRPELLAKLENQHGFKVSRVVDLTAHEEGGEYLEGTGSLVLDRPRRVAYACLSPRTHPRALDAFARTLGYAVTSLRAFDAERRAIYHTNVLMALGARFAVVCTAALVDSDERAHLLTDLESSGRELIELSFEQLAAFAGNLLELRGVHGPVIALSATAFESLGTSERRRLARHGELVTAEIGTIERIGGGSVRCMLTEVALPRALR